MSIQILRGTSAKIKASTTVPKAGQPLYATDTHELYIGDGTTQAKKLTGIVGEATTTLKSDVATLKTNVSTLQATDTKLKAKQFASNANNYVLGGDLSWLKLPNNTIPTFEVNTSTGELVIKINGNDTVIPSSLTVSTASTNNSISSTVNSWGHVMPASYSDLFDKANGAQTLLMMGKSVDANIGDNMSMVTEQENHADWVQVLESKAPNATYLMPNSLAVKLYNSMDTNYIGYCSYGTLTKQAFGLQPPQFSFPIDNVFHSDVQASSGYVVLLLNWSSSLEYNEAVTYQTLANCSDIIQNLIPEHRIVVGIFCKDAETYTTISNKIIEESGIQSSSTVLDKDTDPSSIANEIQSMSNNSVLMLNTCCTNTEDMQTIEQILYSVIPNSALIFLDDSTSKFNKLILQAQSDFTGHGYTIYITNDMYNYYNSIVSPTRPFVLYINDPRDFIDIYESGAYNKFDQIILGADLALSVLRATGNASSVSEAVADYLMNPDLCNEILHKIRQANVGLSCNMAVQYVSGSTQQIIPTSTTIRTITVKQSKSY